MHLRKKWPVTFQANVEVFEVEHVKNIVGVDLFERIVLRDDGV